MADDFATPLAETPGLPKVPKGYGTPQPLGRSNVLEIPQQRSGPMMLPAGQSGADSFSPRDDLINAIVAQESGGNPQARGKAGEIGLMQIMPATAKQYGVAPEQLWNPEVNRQTGARFFGDLLKRYKGNEMLALMAYNSGPGNVDKGRFVPGAVKYAMNVLDRAKQGRLPQMGGQVGAGQPQQPPSMLSRIGGAIESGLEGTAYAQEPPPPPAGYGAPQRLAATGQPQPVGQPPAPPAGYGVPARLSLGGMKPSISIGPTGARIGFTTPTTGQQIQQQALSADTALAQIRDAANFYDQKIGPRWEKDFGGSLLTKSGRRGFMQPYEAQSSRWAQALGVGERAGGQGDPEVSSFYDKVGPAIAAQMRALVGGRLGYYMVTNSPIVPHLPNIDKDSLPRIREKLHDLEENIPIVINQINQMRARGMSDDQIIQQMGGDPSQIPADTGADMGAEPPPPAGFQ